MRKVIRAIMCNNCKKEIKEDDKYYFVYDNDEHDSFDICEDCIDKVCEEACKTALSNPESNCVSVNYASVPYYFETLANNNDYQLLVIDQEYFYLVKTEDEMIGILVVYLKNRFEIKETE